MTPPKNHVVANRILNAITETQWPDTWWTIFDNMLPKAAAKMKRLNEPATFYIEKDNAVFAVTVQQMRLRDER